jgi:hypothetical protein
MAALSVPNSNTWNRENRNTPVWMDIQIEVNQNDCQVKIKREATSTPR